MSNFREQKISLFFKSNTSQILQNIQQWNTKKIKIGPKYAQAVKVDGELNTDVYRKRRPQLLGPILKH